MILTFAIYSDNALLSQELNATQSTSKNASRSRKENAGRTRYSSDFIFVICYDFWLILEPLSDWAVRDQTHWVLWDRGCEEVSTHDWEEVSHWGHRGVLGGGWAGLQVRRFLESTKVSFCECRVHYFIVSIFRTKKECGTRLDKVCSTIKKWACDKPKPEPEPEPESEPEHR